MADFYTGNRFLSQSEMETNARYIYNYLTAYGWTPNAIAGMLGNMQTESTINPGIWQDLNSGNKNGGYGLVQWTPSTNFTDWCAELDFDITHMDSALERIQMELENGLQYYPTKNYPETFEEFSQSTKSPTYLANAFLMNYERPLVTPQPIRGQQAEKWYEFLMEQPFVPIEPPKEKKGLSLMLMYMATKGRF